MAATVASAKLGLKLFLHVNLANRAIRIEDDGAWLLQDETDGIIVVWRIAAEAENEQITEAAIALLVELHHRISGKLQQTVDLRGAFIQRCFSKLSLNIQRLKGNAPINSTGDGRSHQTKPNQTNAPSCSFVR